MPDPFIIFRPEPWTERALCADRAHPDFWFPLGKNEQSTRTTIETRAAIAICSDCPVSDECLTYALTNDERFGVWGGLTAYQRRKKYP